MVRRRRSLFAVLPRRDNRPWRCHRHERSAANYSGLLNSTGANFPGANATGAISAFVPSFQGISSHASTTAAGAIVHAAKIGDLPLFATVGSLAAVWLIATVGLSLTIKREYLNTFVSLQTGCAYSQSYFLDN